jgi:hypothetical protein
MQNNLLDIVDWFGPVPVNRVTKDAAVFLIAEKAHELLGKPESEVIDLMFGRDTFNIGFDDTAPSKRGLRSPSPYLLQLRVPVTALELSELLSDFGAVHVALHGVVIACYALCGLFPDEYRGDERLEVLQAERQRRVQAFHAAMREWHIGKVR